MQTLLSDAEVEHRMSSPDLPTPAEIPPPFYPPLMLPEPGTLTEVASGVFWLRMPLPLALNHINLWLLRDGDGWTIVDTGFGNAATQAHWQQIFDQHLAGMPVNRILVTHNHPDHIGNAAWLAERWQAPVWMSEGEFLSAHLVWRDLAGYSHAELVDFYRSHGVAGSLLEMLAARGTRYQVGVPALPAQFRRILPGDVIRIDEQDWHVIPGYGHSPEHVALYCPALQVLIAGDMLLPTISTNVAVWAGEPDGDPVAMFLASLQRFLPLPADTLVLPSHGKPFQGVHARVSALQMHHADRLAALLAFCNQPRHAVDCLPILFQRVLDGYELFFALGEAVAHLNHLMHRQQLNRIRTDDGIYRFEVV
ncbi:MBL fold metallo-hydrolase [Chitinivorax sp. B]|uniref:MBL fold metallo-hydrolase n=1 Tax=Chitinivorax sp. B TaxID=2502235 RepID=UPI002016B19B|nr:MBL fold metallo-hydrolase [Chitinivorax sp. B]